MSETPGKYIVEVEVAGANRAINPRALAEFGEIEYEHPSPTDVTIACARSGLSSASIGTLLGVDPRNVRRWKSGQIKRMPYAAWRLLLLFIEEAIPITEKTALKKKNLEFLSNLYYKNYLPNTKYQNIEFGEFVEDYLRK